MITKFMTFVFITAMLYPSDTFELLQLLPRGMQTLYSLKTADPQSNDFRHFPKLWSIMDKIDHGRIPDASNELISDEGIEITLCT